MKTRVKQAQDFLSSLQPTSGVDATLRLAVTLALFAWNWLEGAVFENEYPASFVRNYPIPLWRAAVLALLITGALWCPSVGYMMAFAAFFYVMDMDVTLDKWHK